MVTVKNNANKLDEFQEFLRSSDVLTISERGVTTSTETFNGDNSTTQFTVSNSGLKNIRLITISSVEQTKYVDYTIDHDNNQINFTSPPANGTNNISIQYDYGTSGDAIYWDEPRKDISLTSYPRVSIALISDSSVEGDISGALTEASEIYSITSYADTKFRVETVIYNIRNAIQNNKTGFFYTGYLAKSGQGPLITSPERAGQKIMQRNIDFRAPLEIDQ